MEKGEGILDEDSEGKQPDDQYLRNSARNQMRKLDNVTDQAIKLVKKGTWKVIHLILNLLLLIKILLPFYPMRKL